VTLTLTSDDLESHIIMNDSSTLTNTTIWFVAALSLIVDIQTYIRTDIFTGFIRSSRRRWPKNGTRHMPNLMNPNMNIRKDLWLNKHRK